MGVIAPAPPPAYHLYRLLWNGLDWLYPPQCGGCGRTGTRWCADCRAAVREVPQIVCEKCGNPARVEGVCASCRECPPAFNALRSWAIFEGPLRGAIHRLKYKRDVGLGEQLARSLIELLRRLDWPVDLVTAVPIGVARRAERGYNQASLLALPLALHAGRPYRSKALSKVKNTRSQVGLGFAERRKNVAGAFSANSALVNAKNVLVVDDVATSGATMQACAAALMAAGAARVYGLTLARVDPDAP